MQKKKKKKKKKKSPCGWNTSLPQIKSSSQTRSDALTVTDSVLWQFLAVGPFCDFIAPGFCVSLGEGWSAEHKVAEGLSSCLAFES